MQIVRWSVFIALLAFAGLSCYGMAFGDDPRGREILPWFAVAFWVFLVLAFRWAWNGRRRHGT
jgi:O-antigen/teichoic acid export membrane protein